MRIHFLSAGSQGDIQPLVALAAGLKRCGHDIDFWAQDTFASLVHGYGLGFNSFGGTSPKVTLREEFKKRPRTPIGRIQRILHRPAPDRGYLDRLAEAVRGADLVIFNTIMGHCTHVAERLDIPCIGVHYQPFWVTRYLPSPLFPIKRSLGWPLNAITHLFFEQLSWQADRAWVNEWRSTELALPRLGAIRGHARNMLGRKMPQLFAFSSALVPGIKDWPEWFHIPGFFFLDRNADWRPPAPLETFLSEGPPAVSIGFGSIADPDVPRLFQMALEILEERGLRAVVLGGWSDLPSLKPSRNVFMVKEAPHDWLFPRVSAAIHAGGAGTVAATLRAATPSIVVPLHGDQKFWADRLYRLGLSPKPLMPEHRNKQALSAAIQDAVENDLIRQRVRNFAKIIETEQGVERAVRIVNSYIHDAPACEIA